MPASQIVTYGTLGVAGVLALFGMIAGLSRGFCRQLVRLITIAGAIVLAFFATQTLCNTLAAELNGKTVAEICEHYGVNLQSKLGEDTANLLNSIDPELLPLLLSVPFSLILAPSVFVVCFIVISAVLMLVFWFLCGILGFHKSKNNGFTRLLGGVLGLAQGAVVGVILLMPILGLLGVADEAIATVESEGMTEVMSGDTNLLDKYHETCDDFVDGPVYKYMNLCGAEMLYDRLSALSLSQNEEDEINVKDDLVSMLRLAPEIMNVKGADFKALNDDERASLDGIVGKVKANDFLTSVIAGALRTVGNAAHNDAISFDSMDDTSKTLMTGLFDVFSDTAKEDVADDLDTLLEVYYLALDKGVVEAIAGDADVMDTLTAADESGNTPVTLIVNVLKENPHMKQIVVVLTKFAMSTLASDFTIEGVDIDVSEAFDKASEGLKDILTFEQGDLSDEDYQAEIAGKLETTLTTAGIDIVALAGDSGDVINKMAEVIAKDESGEIAEIRANLPEDPSEISEEDIANLMMTYFQTFGQRAEEPAE